MTKQEAIQNAWEETDLRYLFEESDEYGWLKCKPGQYESRHVILNFDRLKLTSQTHSIRPKSLSGIENNNCWIKIESESDLPKDDCDVYFIHEGNILQGRYLLQRMAFDEKYGVYGWKTISHYQPIVKPNKPLY